MISKQKYSHKFIEEKVLKLLKTNGPFFGSSLPINNNDDLATLVLIFMYGYTYNTKYEIEPLNEEVNVNNYRFKDFKVKEKLNG